MINDQIQTLNSKNKGISDYFFMDQAMIMALNERVSSTSIISTFLLSSASKFKQQTQFIIITEQQ